MKLNTTITFLIIIAIFFSCKQKNIQIKNDKRYIDSLTIYLDRFQLDKIERVKKEYNLSSDLQNLIRWHLSYIKYGEINLPPDSITKKIISNNHLYFLKNLTLGEYYQNKSSSDSLAHKYFSEAKKFALRNKNKIQSNLATKKIIELHLGKDNDKARNILSYQIKDLKKYSFDNTEKLWQCYYELRFISSVKKINYIDELLQLEELIGDSNHFLKGRCQQFIGVSYFFFLKNLKKSNEYYLKANLNYEKTKLLFPNSFSFGIKVNIGVNYYKLNQQNESIKYYKEGVSVPIILGRQRYKKSIAYDWIIKYYKNINKLDSALIYIDKKNKLDSLISYGNNLEFSTIYNNQKLRDESEEQKKTYDNYLIVGISFFLFLITISSLTIKNSRRKRLLAIQEKELEIQKNIALAQEKELETQKNLTLLKEQEITTINAMIEGQEKERKRVAEDLHDNLGSVIATLKLHFDNLRINREKKKIDQETLFDKTESLIDEAYKKVRSIAHAKNAGVIANQGLLTAVEIMAEKISSATNNFEIQVVYSGLDTPLDNSLEIALFRIIQELTTNIIKHAEASFVTIGLNEHQDGINIMIEDNGKGMDASQINLKKGMGLHSIQTRVEHLKGDFTIDSTPTKGTTIIINVPT
ncbi:sensor histidine kinase [Pseudotenacibaculum haliotis]|uniref:histidine kinase n=1 Tax=Pseudotenacibaculum haliotis TaxID=1862138 RepID=A0ABW5LVE0_9FLAO